MPSGSYTIPAKDAKSLLLESGGMLMARGYLYDVKTKSIGAGIHRITLSARN